MMPCWVLFALMLTGVSGSQEPPSAAVIELKAVIGKLRNMAMSGKVLAASRDRRLGVAVDFVKLCGSGCWGDIRTGIIDYFTKSEQQCPQVAEAPCTTTPKPATTPKPEADECMFDMCSRQMNTICSGIQSQGMDKYMASLNMNLTACTKLSFNFVCNTICSTKCKTDNSEEKKVFCPPKSSDEEEEDDPCDNSGEGADAMTDMFNFICLKSTDVGKNFYCQAKGMEWESKGAFKEANDMEFPDPCNVDCSGPTGKAIKELGCCMATYIKVNDKHKMMPAKELKNAKAATYKCGGLPAMTFCGGSGAGLMVPTESIMGSKPVAACPKNKVESKAQIDAIVRILSVKATTITLVACVPASSSCQGTGRRLVGGSGANLEYTVSVSGNSSNIAAKKKALQMKVTALNSGTAKSSTTVTATTPAPSGTTPANSASGTANTSGSARSASRFVVTLVMGSFVHMVL